MSEGIIEKKASWFNLNEDFISLCEENKVEVIPKTQGEDKLTKEFEENEGFTKFWYDHYVRLLAGS